MKAVIPLLLLSAVAVFVRAEIEVHPKAILPYLQLKDREAARKVHSYLELRDFKPSRPSGFPSAIPQEVCCIGLGFICHMKAEEDACKHVKCIVTTGKCLHDAGLRLEDLPPKVQNCAEKIPDCLSSAESCDEKLGCFQECLKKLGDEED